jgi:hypothetical protein
MSKLSDSQEKLYDEWFEDQEFEEINDNEIREKIETDLAFVKTLGNDTDHLKEYTFWRCWVRSKEIFPKNNTKEHKSIAKTEKKIWTPKTPEDWYNLNPEVIYVPNQIPIPIVSIWGNERIDFLTNPDNLQEDYRNLTTLTSVAEVMGNVGRSLRFLVRDRNSKKYLGLMTIASDYAEIKSRNDYIGWSKTQRDGGMLNHTAAGSVLVPTQPFGYNFLGGKLIALMSTSDVVTRTWERIYGQKLVGLTTTALYGQTHQGTQYTGLRPIWKSLGHTAGSTEYRTKIETDKFLLHRWMKNRYPREYWIHFEARVEGGQMPLLRSYPERARKFCYRKLGIKNTKTKFQRAVYFAEIYKNTNEFLCGKIAETQLVPKFDNSVDNIKDRWFKLADKRFKNLRTEGRLDFSMQQYMSNLPYLDYDHAKDMYFSGNRR